jgi:alkylation response protein AidB-like acyl-CoA dehydrogenase
VDLVWSQEDERFRAELRSWLEGALPELGPEPEREDWGARRKRDTTWQRMLYDAGYAGINWPAEFGGRGASLSEQLVFYEEITNAGAPNVGVNFVGLLHAGPTLIAEATPEQRSRHLPAILKGDEVWCQGFSEPQAGSDLASLRARAVRDGDDYVISGQKIWTSFAQVSDYCELLVRTDPEAPKHKGISYVLVDMHSPGVTVRPLVQITGDANFNEVFFEDVKVPKKNLMGEKNQGWQVAITTLMFERSGIGGGRDLMGQVKELVELAKGIRSNGHRAWDDTSVRQRLSGFACEAAALRYTGFRQLTRRLKGLPPGPEGSVLKLCNSELNLRMNKFAMEMLGPYSQM